jgi:ribonuclease HI
MVVNEIHIFTDGACRGNPGPAGIAFSIYDEKKNTLFEHKERIGDATNNVAEYNAIIRALEAAAGYCRKKVFVYSDSELVIKQLKGSYKVKKKHILVLFHAVKDKEKAFEFVTYTHLKRDNPRIKRVDMLANMALDG